MSDLRRYDKGRGSFVLRFFFTIILSTSMILSGIALPWAGGVDKAYAKDIGKKNQQACEECKAVQAGTAPAGYTDVLGNKAVYRGGTAKSGLQSADKPLDTDPDTFASPLPYGDTYIDVPMIRWTETSTYIIDIPEGSPFHWVATSAAGASLRDANGRKPETDPMGQKKGISRWVDQEERKTAIAYVGPLKGFHDNFTDAASETGNTNEIKASDYRVPYLYKIVYPEAVTLPSGVRGNLVITVDHVDIETTFTVDEDHPRTLKAKDGSSYTYTEAIVAVQNGNSMAASTAIIDGEGNYITQNIGVVKTAEEVREQLKGKVGNADLEASSQDKMPRGATGVHVDIEVQVTDVDGNEVEGTISYSAYDLDLMSYQNVWGRKSTGNDRLEFAEGLQIVSGSQSYALVPEYNHASGTTLNAGWVPVGPNDNPLSSPLNISGGGGSHADGANFRAIGIVNYRDKDGTWDNALFNVSNNANDAQTMITFPNGVPWNENGQLTKPYNSTAPGWQVRAQLGLSDTATGVDVFGLLGDASWATERADDDTFDTGFAVLLDAKKSKLRWSGSASSQGTVVTTLFDSTLFTYIEQTHGTGGGIYLESYKINDECKPAAKEGVVTMGKGADATVTAVPEEGYRIKEFKIGGAGLKKPKTYTLKNLGLTPGMAGSTTVDDITFEMNADGTVDVTFKNIQDAHHIHVDFDADYYFYKIWKGDEEPTKLEMTAVPYAYIFTDVTLPVPTGIDSEGRATYTNTHFSIDGTSYTADDGTAYVLGPGNMLETVAKDPASGEPLITLPYVLRGNDFVAADGTKHSVTVKFGVNFAMGDGTTEESVKKTFTVDDTTKYTNDGYVKVLTDGGTISPGNVVWKIKYPAEGVISLNWPALPIETEPSVHNVNHVERNYWFTTEKAPAGWSKEGYDNSKAEAPGVVPSITGEYAGYYDNHVWAAASKKDYDAATTMIKQDNKTKNAFMSVFSKDDGKTTKDTYGGEITNVPGVAVKAEKTWADFKNQFNIRQDIWLHIDARVGNKITEDILPPQKLAKGGTEEKQTVIWGDLQAYDTHQENVKIIEKLADIPLKDDKGQRVSYTHESDGSYKASNGITYWLNELVKVDAEGNEIEYTIRETLDADGEKPVEKSDPESGLVGYTAETDEVAWDDMDKTGKTEIGEGDDKIEVDTYEGELTNELALKDFQITKIWKENGSNHTHSLDADAAKLKEAFTLQENGETWTEVDGTPKLQPKDAEEYVADPEAGTLEIKQGKDKTEVVFIWHNVPVGIADTDDEGNPIVRKTEFSVVENQLNGYEAPQYSGEDKALDKGTVTNEVLPPEGEPRETWGEKNKPQKANGKNMFKVTTETDIDGNPNKIEKVELIDPNTDKPADTVDAVDKDGNKVGTYTVDENGVITFTPEPDFVGDPPPVTVRGTDSNGLAAETTYTPHVVETTKKVTRTIEYFYDNGDPVLGEDDKPLKVVQVTEFAGTLNPETGEVIYPEDAKGIMDEIESPDITNWNYDKEKVGEVTVYPTSNDMYEKVIYSPVGIKPTADVTYGLPNETQIGEPKFEMEDGSEGEITVKLIDPHTGEPVDGDTVDAVDKDGKKVGTYTLNPDGTVTFTPDKDYVGNPRPLDLEGTAKNDQKARTTYTPHIVNPEITDTASRNIYYTYETKDGKEVTGSDKQTVIIRKHPKKVDPKTGEVLEWGDWEPTKFPALKNPDDKVDGRIWFTEDSVDEQIVTEPGEKEDVHVVYQKIPYTVKYLDGKHGKSDGKGDQKDVPYGEMVKGGNKVTPNSGYKFTGKYTYVIKDRDGNIIKTGETDDPTSVEVIGNIEFTPVYKKLPTAIYVDPATGRTIQRTLPFLDDNTEPDPPKDPTRKGYKFVGWNRYEEYDENGELVNVRYEAIWEKVSSDGSGSSKTRGTKTGDNSQLAMFIGFEILLAALLAAVLIIRRRRIS